MAQRKGITTGTTAQRSIEEQGKLRFNTTTSLLEYYDGTQWKSIDAPPVVSSISPSSFVSDGSSTPTITITGSGFSNTINSVKFVGDDGTEYTSATVTRDSATQVTAQVTTAMTVANEPYDVKVTNSSGLAGTLADALDAGGSPTFVTAAGSLGSVADSFRDSTTLSITITDPDSSGTISTSISAGSLPAGASISSAQTPGQTILSISGFSAVGSNTTSTFTIEATDGANTSSREFSITILAPVYQSFTSSGTFSVPSGVTAVNVLVVAGGGGGAGGGYGGGGGGAGGLIYRPGFPVTPGGTVTVTVGCGGASPAAPNASGPSGSPGQDSVFGTLTAKGGGGGGHFASAGQPGGSGGGAGRDGPQPGGATTQPTQPGDSGTYGFGFTGGGGGGPTLAGAGGGGGAGASGQNGGPNDNPITASPEAQRGQGGAGKAYTIADGTTSVYYAGGGGGSVLLTPGPGNIPNGGQGGGGKGGTGNANPGYVAAQPGTANRGGGGGGQRHDSGSPNPGGSGGKGIVIVQY